MIRIIFTSLLLVLSGCSYLPVLEGGEVKAVHSDSTGKEVVESALIELSKIDLMYLLDPENKGKCNSLNSAVTLSRSALLKCAINGFYSFEYFSELSPKEISSLDVSKISDVAYEYTAKHAKRITKLAKDFDSVNDASPKRYYDQTAANIQKNIIEEQVKELTRRTLIPRESMAFLEFQRRRRNHVQSSILLASNAACDLYKRKLNNVYSTTNFSFGTVATVAGGLGAILTNPDDARALAGVSGITSGLRAEFNDAFFRNKVVELLTKAIDIARTRKREEIKRRSTQIVSDYSVEDALNDAILYNSTCTLVAGLQETSESLQTVSDPGLKWMANAFGGAVSDEKLTQDLFKSLGSAVGKIQKIQKQIEDPNATLIEESHEE